MVFAAATLKDKNEFRATLSTMWVILNGITFATNIANGQFYNSHMLILSSIVIGTSLLSLLIAKLVLKKIKPDSFMYLTYGLLFISGVFAVLS